MSARVQFLFTCFGCGVALRTPAVTVADAQGLDLDHQLKRFEHMANNRGWTIGKPHLTFCNRCANRATSDELVPVHDEVTS